VIPIPADVPGQQVAAGTARVISSGRVAEPATNYDGSPATGGGTVNVSVQNTYKDFAISGTLTQRRTVVSNDKCNACHSTLGTAAGSNTHLSAFHGGSRNFVESCVICHDPGRVSSGTVMADGSPTFNESYHFKRMIHGLHAAPTSVRTYPYTHDNTVRDSFDKNCVSTTDMVTVCSDAGDPTAVTNFAKEVAWPGNIADCNTCHVNDSWKEDRGVLGSVVVAGAAQKGAPDALVISPKTATCLSCHDAKGRQNHATLGGGAFGTLTQADIIAGAVFESCNGCHGPGSFVSVEKHLDHVD
jgi:OmcA/MtrC family decaheme c-type cytochrome